MIKSFKHKGIECFFKTGNKKGIQAEHSKKLQMILSSLNVAKSVEVLDIPLFRLHVLKGNLQGFCSMTVQANWRVIFKFDGEDIQLVDYH